MILFCLKPPATNHVFEAATSNHPNILEDNMYQPWGSKCLCGKIEWGGHKPQSNGIKEFVNAPLIKKIKELKRQLMK